MDFDIIQQLASDLVAIKGLYNSVSCLGTKKAFDSACVEQGLILFEIFRVNLCYVGIQAFLLTDRSHVTIINRSEG